MTIDRAALELIAREGTGSVRDSISLLDQMIADPDEHITLAMAQDILGTASGQNVVELAEALIDSDAARGLDLINAAMDGGADPRQFGRQMVEHLRQVLLVQMARRRPDRRRRGAPRRASTTRRTRIGRKALLAAIRAFNGAVQDWQGGWQPQLPLELAFLGAASSRWSRTSRNPAAAARPGAHAGRSARAGRAVPRSGPPRKPPRRDRPVDPVGRARPVGQDLKSRSQPRSERCPPCWNMPTRVRSKGDRWCLGVTNSHVQTEARGGRQAPRARKMRVVRVLALALQVTCVAARAAAGPGRHDLLAEDDVLAFGVNELGGEITELTSEFRACKRPDNALNKRARITTDEEKRQARGGSAARPVAVPNQGGDAAPDPEDAGRHGSGPGRAGRRYDRSECGRRRGDDRDHRQPARQGDHESIRTRSILRDEEWLTDLQDLLVVAMNQAIEQSQALAARAYGGVTGGLVRHAARAVGGLLG